MLRRDRDAAIRRFEAAMALVSASPLFQRCGLPAPLLPAAAGPLEFVEAAAAAQLALKAVEAALGAHAEAGADVQGAC